MLIQALFSMALATTEHNLSTDQQTAVKQRAVIFFASNVLFKGLVSVSEFDALSINANIANLSKHDMVGDDIIVTYRYADYSIATIPITYQSVVLEIFEYFILQTSLTNLNVIKGLGVEEMQQQQQQDLATLKKYLVDTFGGEISFSVGTSADA